MSDELRVGENTKMCDKCLGFHAGLTCKQYASRDEMQNNAMVAVGALCEYIEELTKRWDLRHVITADSELGQQGRALLKQVMAGPKFEERAKRQAHACNLASLCFDDAKQLATFVVPEQFRAPFVAAVAARLDYTSVIPSEKAMFATEEELKRATKAPPQEKTAEGSDRTEPCPWWTVCPDGNTWQLKDGYGVTQMGALYPEELRRICSQLNAGRSAQRDCEFITRNYNTLVHALGGPLYGANNPEANASLIRGEHDRLKKAIATLTYSNEEACKRAHVVYTGDTTPITLAETVVSLRRELEQERLDHEKTKHRVLDLECEVRNKTIEGPLQLAMRAIDYTVDYGTHHTGRHHAETPIQKVLESIAGELIELTCAVAVVKYDHLAMRRELADVFIAFVHAMKKLGVSNVQLAAEIIEKLWERNRFSEEQRPEFEKLKRNVIKACNGE